MLKLHSFIYIAFTKVNGSPFSDLLVKCNVEHLLHNCLMYTDKLWVLEMTSKLIASFNSYKETE